MTHEAPLEQQPAASSAIEIRRFNAMLSTLQRQRNEAADAVVRLSAELAVANDERNRLSVQLLETHERLSRLAPASLHPTTPAGEP